ncbi:MAG: DegT/DnrJ/EryC1/StrS family aminotransferase [Candidatus Rokubacteria bacterium]|nr:DegT/DnrJ/EryC1/StrS family aminotransferase [Candidatus Rokubacteria bacterium]
MASEKLALFGGAPVRPALLPYARQSIDAEDIAAVSRALAGDWITQGPGVKRFEKALAASASAGHMDRRRTEAVGR